MSDKTHPGLICSVMIALFFGGAQTQQKELTIKVLAPPLTPADARLTIAGNDSSFGEWDATKILMKKENDSVWSFHSRFVPGTALEFKITRGSWNSEAVYQHSVIPPNFALTVANDTTITIRPISWKDFDYKTPGGITGTVRYHRGMQTSDLPNPRDVIVWLPPSYEKENAKRYPVLYMHDGQNIIDPAISFGGADWRVDEVADSLIKAAAIAEIIIVGIFNTKDRNPEYSDTKLGRAYGDFVIHTLKPMIDSVYRTEPGRKHTAVMGSSMGGLISFLFVWWYPEVFSAAGCVSSGFVVDSNKILKDVRTFKGLRKNVRIYLDVGSVGIESRLKPGYDEMIGLLKGEGYEKGKDLEYFYDKGAEHNERAWARRVWRPLVFFFGK